jgi:hypothetical protein
MEVGQGPIGGCSAIGKKNSNGRYRLVQGISGESIQKVFSLLLIIFLICLPSAFFHTIILHAF